MTRNAKHGRAAEFKGATVDKWTKQLYIKATEEECFQSAFHHEVVLVTDTTVDSFNVQSDEP